MAQELPDCQHISSNLTYDCSNPYPSCTSAKHFDFSTLWNYTNLIYQSCPNDTRLYRANALTQNLPLSKNSISLTQDACVAVAGGGWKRYPRSDIWTRLTTWKFPLLQLAFSFPRPPLSFAIESFVVIHLLGDPIDTIANLLRKVSMCQRWARHWQNNRDGGHHWKALALITDSYAEWGKDEQAKDVLEEAL